MTQISARDGVAGRIALAFRADAPAEQSAQVRLEGALMEGQMSVLFELLLFGVLMSFFVDLFDDVAYGVAAIEHRHSGSHPTGAAHRA